MPQIPIKLSADDLRNGFAIDAAMQVRLSLKGSTALAKAAGLYVWGPDQKDLHGDLKSIHTALQNAFAAPNPIWALRMDSLSLFNAQNPASPIVCPVDLINPHFASANLNVWGVRMGYSPDAITLLETFLPDNGVFYDVGANWAYFSFHTLLRPNFTGQIFAFEPMPVNIKSIQEVLSVIPHPERLKILEFAVGDKTGELPISDDVWSGTHTLYQPKTSSRTVAVRRIDDLDLPPPDYMKFDVENFEAAAMRGALETIRKHRPKIIFESWLSDDPEITLAPMQILFDLGYKLFWPKFAPEQDRQHQLGETVNGTLFMMPIKDVAARLQFEKHIDIFAYPA